MEIKKYEEIIEEIGVSNITYADLLRTEEWREKRKEILKRDKNLCSDCFKLGSIIKDKKAYRKKTLEEIESDKIEMEKVYKEGLELFMNFAKSMGFKEPYDLPKKPEIESWTLDFEPTFLHVHHNYYVRNRKPWEYENDALKTVCHNCHQKIHETTEILVYTDNTLTNRESNIVKCSKCNGSGFINEYHYYLDGICFKCNGRGY